MSRSFIFGFRFMQGTFYFIPTLLTEWGDCGCFKLEICIGNFAAAIGLVCAGDKRQMEKYAEN